MALYFITGNKGKFAEAKRVMPELEQLDIDLPEVQDMDPHKIIRAKLESAFEHHQGPFIVEDTSVHFDCLNGLPGPFIKWFLEAMGNEGLYDITKKFDNFRAQVTMCIGYAKDKSSIQFFDVTIPGTIVSPKGTNGFGWDAIFQREGLDKTFAEMTDTEKDAVSIRRAAFEKLKEVL